MGAVVVVVVVVCGVRVSGRVRGGSERVVVGDWVSECPRWAITIRIINLRA